MIGLQQHPSFQVETVRQPLTGQSPRNPEKESVLISLLFFSLWLIRRSPAATAVPYSPSRKANRSSTQVRTCPLPSAVRAAATLARTIASLHRVKCTRPFAPSAEQPVRFRSSPVPLRRVAARFSARTASWQVATKDAFYTHLQKRPRKRAFFVVAAR